MIARLRTAARHVELVAMVAAALLLATVGAVLTAIEGPAPDPLDDRERPSHR